MSSAGRAPESPATTRLTGWLLAAALGLGAGSAAAAPPDTTFLEQYAATYRFRLGQPTAVKLTPDGRAVLFLRSGPRSFVQDLYEFDVATRTERVVLTAEQILRGAEERLTPEEKARRERLRVSTRGIVSYKISEDGKRLLVPLSGRLFVIERAGGAVTELAGSPGFPIDPQLSPDGTRVACVRDGDLYVTDIASGRETRLTEGASDTLTHGLAEFVAQEEMDRFSGYWWSPDGSRIAYQETDLAPVEVLHIADPAHPEKAPDAWRYPRPGQANARVRLGIVAAAGGPTTWVSWDRERYAYLARVRWEKNAPLTLLVQNRPQTEEALLAVDAADGATRTLLVETDSTWLNLDGDMPHWLEDGSGFLWTSERDGAWQLELRGRDGALLRRLTPPGFNLRGFVALDESHRRVWVTGGEDPTQLQVFRVPLGPGRPAAEPVTRESGWHAAVVAKNGRAWVRTRSGAESGPVHTVMDASGKPLAALRAVTETPGIRTHLSFEAVGPARLRAVVVRPADFRPGERYPVIVNVYGGPHAQQARQSAYAYLLDQWFADQGYIVVALDGRGTPARGRAWERAIKGDLIGLALADQVDGLRALAAAHPEMDLARVGIFGWSFGGYFAAMAVMQRPDVFRAAMAGAPVADWRDYDTHYTERYLGLPDADLRAYEASSVLTYVPRLARPLLLVHGTVDDNVYFLHSMKLADALFRAGKEFEFLPLPGFTHSVPDPLVTKRLYGRIAEFFDRSVKRAAP